MTALRGHFERLTAPVTAADSKEKYGSDAQLICLSDAWIFSLIMKIHIHRV
ncbi:hypothetical protein [Pseudomonas fluorescens]|uniref:hypothetical protein n=1 Tax=Pseudomonas fluorescens TaxID=294 RepID=UPI0015596678|nr:hypothetical protein [Pseudomonas fluorescens]